MKHKTIIDILILSLIYYLSEQNEDKYTAQHYFGAYISTIDIKTFCQK